MVYRIERAKRELDEENENAPWKKVASESGRASAMGRVGVKDACWRRMLKTKKQYTKQDGLNVRDASRLKTKEQYTKQDGLKIGMRKKI